MNVTSSDALLDVVLERRRQEAMWGLQSHPHGTGKPEGQLLSKISKDACDLATKNGTLTWALILEEEVDEAFAELDPAELRCELIQVAAVAIAWVEAIDRKAASVEE